MFILRDFCLKQNFSEATGVVNVGKDVWDMSYKEMGECFLQRSYHKVRCHCATLVTYAMFLWWVGFGHCS